MESLGNVPSRGIEVQGNSDFYGNSVFCSLQKQALPVFKKKPE